MKKYLWIVALLASLAMVMTGCPGNGPKDPPVGPVIPDEAYDDLWDDLWVEGDSKTRTAALTLTDNFEYGNGYQGLVAWTSLFNSAIKVKDVYQLEIQFTLDRDLEDKLDWGLVDPAPPSYWTELTRWKVVAEGDDKEEGPPEPGENSPDGPITPGGGGLSKETTITYTGRIVVTKAGPASSNLVFQTKGSGTKGTPGSGVKGPAKLTFTKFKITKLEYGEAPVPPVPPPEEDYGNMGPPAYNKGTGDEDGAESQAKWVITDELYDIMAIYGSKLVVTFENAIAGKIQLIWQGGASGTSGWNSSDILEDDGSAIEAMGTEVSGDKKTLTIDLSKALADYNTPSTGFLASTGTAKKTQIFLAYYTGDKKMAGLKVVKADLIAGEISDEFVPVTDLEYASEVRGFASVPIVLGAKVTPLNATIQDIVWTTTTTGATITDGKLTPTTVGKVTVTATITGGGEDEEDFTKTFTNVIDIIALPTADSFTTFVGKSTIGDNKTIGFGGYDGDLDIELFKTLPAYLVVAVWGTPTDKEDGSGPNTDGWGGIQVALQSPVDNYAWHNLSSADWTAFPNGEEVVYLLVDISKLDGYATIISGVNSTKGAKLILNYGFKRYLGSWITTNGIFSTLTAHGGDGAFFITKTPEIFVP
jgi:ribosomal protein S10